MMTIRYALNVNQYLLARIIAMLLSLTMVIALAQRARGQEFFVNVSFDVQQKEAIPLNLLVGQSRIIKFDRPIGRLSVSSTDVAEAVVVSGDQVVVNGKTFGQINFVAWDKGGDRSVVFEVFVRANLALLDGMVRGLFPNENIQLSQANGSVILSGKVSDAKKATQIDSAVQAAGFKTVNLLEGPFKNAAQVQLLVRVAEVNRTKAREFGTSYAYQSSPGTGGYANSGTGPYSVTKVEEGSIFGTPSSALNLFIMGANTFNFIRVLQSQGALRALAEPNLIAMDGQQASFLAGGEFPVPIVQTGSGTSSISIMFKEYGVRLGFKPTIVSENYIRLELEPEVSTIDYVNGVKLDGFTIPGLRTRRAKTGIELQDGQSFALAGLLDNSETRSFSKMPLIGDVPVLGSLFRSSSFQKQETELMFIVTVHIVKPLNPDSVPKIPGVDGLKSSSPLSHTLTNDNVTGSSNASSTISSTPPAPGQEGGAADTKSAPPSPTVESPATPAAPAASGTSATSAAPGTPAGPAASAAPATPANPAAPGTTATPATPGATATPAGPATSGSPVAIGPKQELQARRFPLMVPRDIGQGIGTRKGVDSVLVGAVSATTINR